MEFGKIVAEHTARYPRMTPQDCGKLAYQNAFGPEHLMADEGAVCARLLEEWNTVPVGTSQREPEDIGGGLCRFYLYDSPEKELEAQVLVKLFCLTAKTHQGSLSAMEENLEILEGLSVPGMKEWLESYRAEGYPPVRHSGEYRQAYAPRYRLLKWEYARVFPTLVETARILRDKGRAVVAIDGRCGSGKSTLGELMEQVFDCRVFHMDDFYLPKNRRAENWMSVPGGNMDLERFKREVLKPVFAGEEVLYRPFDCSTGSLGAGEHFPPSPLTVIEGSYSHHPDLEAPYDLKIFLTCEKGEQRRRLMIREGDYFPTFEALWMPLEEQYIRLCRIEERGAVIFDTAK